MKQLNDEQIQDLIDTRGAIADSGEALLADAASTAVYLEGVLASTAPTERQLARLAERAAGGSDRARDQFVEASQRMLLALAVELEAPAAPLLDLVQEGNMALLGALTDGKCDPAALEAAARAAMGAYAGGADADTKIPAHLAEVVGEYVAVHQHLVEQLGREPSDGQMAEHMDQPVELIEEAKAFLEGLDR